MEWISLWPQRIQNEHQFYYLYPKSVKCDMAVNNIYEDVTENVNTKYICFIQIQAWDRDLKIEGSGYFAAEFYYKMNILNWQFPVQRRYYSIGIS